MSGDVAAGPLGQTSEFSRPIPVARAVHGLDSYRIEASALERAALARRFDFLAVERLEAVIATRPLGGGTMHLTLTLSASLTQACVVTLDPVPEILVDVSAIEFRPGLSEEEADRLTFEAVEDLVIEPLPPVSIDLGEIAAQQLALAADPFPRSAAAIDIAMPFDLPGT